MPYTSAGQYSPQRWYYTDGAGYGDDLEQPDATGTYSPEHTSSAAASVIDGWIDALTQLPS